MMNVEEKKENASNQNEENSNMKFEKKPETVEEKLQEQKEEIDEKDDRIKRLMAEFENFKKRSDKERLGMYNSVMGDVVMKLLPVLDNLEKAVAAESKDEQYKNGIEMVEKQFQDVLRANGVKEIESIGKPFDPSLHEAVSLVEDSNLGPKTIKEEYRKGYTIGDKVLRHSLVVVAN